MEYLLHSLLGRMETFDLAACVFCDLLGKVRVGQDMLNMGG
jgi:hypothetical protein